MNTAKSQVGVCVCVCVWKEFIKNSAKHISNEQINAALVMCSHIPGQGVTLCALVICFTLLTKNVQINTLVMHR